MPNTKLTSDKGVTSSDNEASKQKNDAHSNVQADSTIQTAEQPSFPMKNRVKRNIFNRPAWKQYELNHTVFAMGDSTLDDELHTETEAPEEQSDERSFVSSKSLSTVGQLQNKYKGKAHVYKASNDGTDTENMLNTSGYKDNAVIKGIASKKRLASFGYKGKRINQFKALDEHITRHGKPDHVVLSVGGNDFRKYLGFIPVAPGKYRAGFRDRILKGIKNRYIKILEEYEKRGITPLIMTQYVPNEHQDDIYHIFQLMKWIRQQDSLSTIRNEAGQKVAASEEDIKDLAEMMLSVYKEVFKVAKDKGIPIADATSTHQHNNNLHNLSQIEPSHIGSQRLATLLHKVSMIHDYDGGSKVYSLSQGSDILDVINNDDNYQWKFSPCLNRMALDDLKHSTVEIILKKDHPDFLTKVEEWLQHEYSGLDSIYMDRAKSLIADGLYSVISTARENTDFSAAVSYALASIEIDEEKIKDELKHLEEIKTFADYTTNFYTIEDSTIVEQLLGISPLFGDQTLTQHLDNQEAIRQELQAVTENLGQHSISKLNEIIESLEQQDGIDPMFKEIISGKIDIIKTVISINERVKKKTANAEDMTALKKIIEMELINPIDRSGKLVAFYSDQGYLNQSDDNEYYINDSAFWPSEIISDNLKERILNAQAEIDGLVQDSERTCDFQAADGQETALKEAISLFDTNIQIALNKIDDIDNGNKPKYKALKEELLVNQIKAKIIDLAVNYDPDKKQEVLATILKNKELLGNNPKDYLSECMQIALKHAKTHDERKAIFIEFADYNTHRSKPTGFAKWWRDTKFKIANIFGEQPKSYEQRMEDLEALDGKAFFEHIGRQMSKKSELTTAERQIVLLTEQFGCENTAELAQRVELSTDFLIVDKASVALKDYVKAARKQPLEISHNKDLNRIESLANNLSIESLERLVDNLENKKNSGIRLNEPTPTIIQILTSLNLYPCEKLNDSKNQSIEDYLGELPVSAGASAAAADEGRINNSYSQMNTVLGETGTNKQPIDQAASVASNVTDLTTARKNVSVSEGVENPTGTNDAVEDTTSAEVEDTSGFRPS